VRNSFKVFFNVGFVHPKNSCDKKNNYMTGHLCEFFYETCSWEHYIAHWKQAVKTLPEIIS